MWELAAVTGGSGSTWADANYPSRRQTRCDKSPPSVIQEASECKHQGQIKSACKIALGFSTASSSLGFVVLVSALGRGWAWGWQVHQGLSGSCRRKNGFIPGLGSRGKGGTTCSSRPTDVTTEPASPPQAPSTSRGVPRWSPCPLGPLCGGHWCSQHFVPEPWAPLHLRFSL